MSEDKSYFKNKKILVTGAAGTIGQNFLSTIKDYNLKNIVGIDNDDKNLVKLQNEISKCKNIQLVHADIRNKEIIANDSKKPLITINIIKRINCFFLLLLNIESTLTNIESFKYLGLRIFLFCIMN